MTAKYIYALFILSLFTQPTNGQTSTGKTVTLNSIRNFQITYVPDSFSFAGETVPLKDDLIREQWERELLYNADFFSNITYIIKLSGRHFPPLEAALREHGIPEDMKYLCVAESNLQQLISKAGAVGFWQFMPQTAVMYGLEVNKYVDERYNIQKSTKAACLYLKNAYKKFGSWTAAAASYNCGQGGYNAAAVFQKSKNYYDLMLPEETNHYVFRILTFKYFMENAAALNLINKEEMYEPENYREINVTSGINNLVSFAIENNITYKELRIHNPWLRDKMLPARNSKTYTLLIPDKSRNKE